MDYSHHTPPRREGTKREPERQRLSWVHHEWDASEAVCFWLPYFSGREGKCGACVSMCPRTHPLLLSFFLSSTHQLTPFDIIRVCRVAGVWFVRMDQSLYLRTISPSGPKTYRCRSVFDNRLPSDVDILWGRDYLTLVKP